MAEKSRNRSPERACDIKCRGESALVKDVTLALVTFRGDT